MEVDYSWSPFKDCFPCIENRLFIFELDSVPVMVPCLTRSYTNLFLGMDTKQHSAQHRLFPKTFGKPLEQTFKQYNSLSFKVSTSFSTIHRMTEICMELPMVYYATLDKSQYPPPVFLSVLFKLSLELARKFNMVSQRLLGHFRRSQFEKNKLNSKCL